MGPELPDAVSELKARARAFVDGELIPIEKDWPHHTDEVPIEKKVEIGTKAREAGLVGAGRPKELGGQGLGSLGSIAVVGELARTTVGFSTFYDVGFPFLQEPFPIFFESSGHIREKYLRPLTDEGKTYAMMMTEPQSGSDFPGMRTTARRDGDNYILNGVKMFPTGYLWSAFSVVWAVLEDPSGNRLLDDKGRNLITTFLVDADNPGFEVTGWVDVLGIDREPIVDLRDCVVPAANMLGGPGEGRGIAMGQMNRARLGWGAACIGASERCLELAVEYARERKAFGRPIGRFQAIQWMIADSYVELQAMRQLLYHTAAEADRNGDLQQVTSQTRCATLKLFNLSRALTIVDRCMQIHGAMGMTNEYPFEYLHRQLKSARAAEGTPEIMRHIIATDLLGRDLTAL